MSRKQVAGTPKCDTIASLQMMKLIIRYALWTAWALCAFVISSTVDDIPDSPALLKDSSISQPLLDGLHAQLIVEPQERTSSALPENIVLRWQDIPQTPASGLAPNSLGAICRVSDSSPPSFRS